MPNNTVISNIKKKLEVKKFEQNELIHKNLLFLNKQIEKFREYILTKFINNDFKILYANKSYYILESYDIFININDDFYASEKDCDYLIDNFKSNLFELTGINNINISTRITDTGLIVPLQIINFEIVINLNDIDAL